jgi:hypothetical protein
VTLAMAKALNFVLFQVVWFLAVSSAADGELLIGPAAAAVFLVVHLVQVHERERPYELAYILGVTLLGAALDAGLFALGATGYPTSGVGAVGAWPDGLAWLPPGWILSLWLAFACLPRFSLAWLRGRPGLAAGLGAIGGPLSYLGGARMGATAVETPALTIVALAVEYALVTPLLLALAPKPSHAPEQGASAASAG